MVFDVYNSQGVWVGAYNCEYDAEIMAMMYDGYYTERFE